MGVIQKKASGGSDKKKNKVKDKIKSKLETNTKFQKVPNPEKPGKSMKFGENVAESKKKKKKFEKSGTKGSTPGEPKQIGNKSPKKKNKKQKNALKQKPEKPKKNEEDVVDDTPITGEEEAEAVQSALMVKKDNAKISKLLAKILKKGNITEEVEIHQPVDGLKLEELISKDKLLVYVKNFMKIIKHTKAQPEYKTKLLNDKRLLTLSILSMKIPECINKFVKINLPVPLYKAESEICLFVADLKRGRKRDDEPFVRHYEEILEKNGVTCINKVMTISHLIKEYSTYELKLRLANTYDVFLVEGKIKDRIGKFLGSVFAHIKRNPIMIKDFTNNSIQKALSSTIYRQSGLGPVNVINFAYDSMNESEITENLYSVIQQLRTNYPGGWTNIKSLTLTALKEIAYPIMYNFALPNCIPVPKLKSNREIKVEREKNLLDGALQKVEIIGDGRLVKKKSKRQFDQIDSENEILNESIEADDTSTKPKKKKNRSDENDSENQNLNESIVDATGEDGTTAKTKKKKKKKSTDKQLEEPILQHDPEPEVLSTFKKDKKKKKQLVIESETLNESPEPVARVIKKSKKNKKNLTANFNGTDSSLVTNKQSSQITKFEKPTDEVKPKKKKFNQTN